VYAGVRRHRFRVLGQLNHGGGVLGRRRISPVLDRFAIVPPKLTAELAETLRLRQFRGSTRTAVGGPFCGMRHEVIVA
jgi:hypothetical protein